MLHVLDGIERQLQRIRCDLRTHRLQPLADRGGADVHAHLAVTFENEPRAFLGPGGASFEVAADSAAAIAAVDQLPIRCSLRAPIDLIEAALQGLAIIAAVGLRCDVQRLHRQHGVGHLRSRNQIAAPKLHPIDAKLGGRDVEQALAKEISLEPSRPAIGPHGRLVGHDEGHIDAHVGNAVGAREHLRDIARGGRAIGADIRTLVGSGVSAQRENRAIAIAGDLQLAGSIAGVIGGKEMLPPVLDPLHRMASEAGGKRDEIILGIKLAARAEAAPNIVLNHPDRALRQPHLLREHTAIDKRDFRRAVHGHLALLCVPVREQPARLHGYRAMTLHAELLPSNVGCVLESSGCIAAYAA